MRKFYVVVVQWTSKKCTQKRDTALHVLFRAVVLPLEPIVFWHHLCCHRRGCSTELPINYSKLSPCGHRTITDTPFVAEKFLIISDLTETGFGYDVLSVLWRSLTRRKVPYNSCLSFFSERFLVSISKSDSTQSLNKSDSSQRINQVHKIDNSACVFTVSMV